MPTVTQLLGEVNEFDRRRREEVKKEKDEGGEVEEGDEGKVVVKQVEAKIPGKFLFLFISLQTLCHQNPNIYITCPKHRLR